MEKFSELTEAIGGKVDAEAGIVRGVRILGRVSKNGRRSSDKAMESCCRLYADRKVHINHQRDSKGERQFETIFAEVKNPVIKGDYIEGDLQYLTKHPVAPQFSEAAEKFPRSFGLSHHAEGTTKREGKDTIVEDVTAVHSVDLVADPATNNGLFESVAPQYPDAAPEMSGDEQAQAKAACQQMAIAILSGPGTKEEKLEKLSKLLDMTDTPSEGEGEAKESQDMKPEDVTNAINEAITGAVKPLKESIDTQAATIAAQALQLKCHNAGIVPTKELLESFKDKDEAFITTKLTEMAAEQAKEGKGKPGNPPAAGAGNYERIKKELGVKRGE